MLERDLEIQQCENDRLLHANQSLQREKDFLCDSHKIEYDNLQRYCNQLQRDIMHLKLNMQ
jgi:hypothetical protein